MGEDSPEVGKYKKFTLREFKKQVGGRRNLDARAAPGVGVEPLILYNII